MTPAPDSGPPPLDSIVALDLSRMLPGAMLSRILIDLGARVIKVEDPGGGDPLRNAPPFVDGIGAGFCAFYRGAESVAVDLREESGAAVVRRLARVADVLIESFRPGTLAGWGLGKDRLRAINPALVTCSLSGFGATGPWRRRAGHDLNFIAMSGLLHQLGPVGPVPRVQVADIAAGMLAATAILAALLRRTRTATGCDIDQPLATSPLPFTLWAWAESAIGDFSTIDALLSGACPAYRVYTCGDGKTIAVGALEPKFWLEFVEVLGLPHLATVGLDSGEDGALAAQEVARRLATAPSSHWLEECAARALPVSAVNDVNSARQDALYRESTFLEETPLPNGERIALPGPFVGSFAPAELRPAPALGQHTEQVLARLSPE